MARVKSKSKSKKKSRRRQSGEDASSLYSTDSSDSSGWEEVASRITGRSRVGEEDYNVQRTTERSIPMVDPDRRSLASTNASTQPESITISRADYAYRDAEGQPGSSRKLRPRPKNAKEEVEKLENQLQQVADRERVTSPIGERVSNARRVSKSSERSNRRAERSLPAPINTHKAELLTANFERVLGHSIYGGSPGKGPTLAERLSGIKTPNSGRGRQGFSFDARVSG